MPTTITLTLPNLPAHLFCQLLRYASPSLLDHFPCSSPYLIVMHTDITEALASSLSLFCPLCLIWAAFFPSLSLEVHWRKRVREWVSEREKKEIKENASDALTCIWLSISMVAWPPETAHHAPLHLKRTECREGAERGRVWRRRERWRKLRGHWSGSFKTPHG